MSPRHFSRAEPAEFREERPGANTLGQVPDWICLLAGCERIPACDCEMARRAAQNDCDQIGNNEAGRNAREKGNCREGHLARAKRQGQGAEAGFECFP
jgi:hypothetical protein